MNRGITIEIPSDDATPREAATYVHDPHLHPLSFPRSISSEESARGTARHGTARHGTARTDAL